MLIGQSKENFQFIVMCFIVDFENHTTYIFATIHDAIGFVVCIIKELEGEGIIGSMSKSGCPYDNSCMESFFASMKKECTNRKEYATMESVKQDMFWYIEMFYNRKRLHSSLGYMSPVAYRLKNQKGQVA